MTIIGLLAGLMVVSFCTSCQLTDLLTKTPVIEEPIFEPNIPDEPVEDQPEVPAVFALLSAYEADTWVDSAGVKTGTEIQVVADYQPIIFQVRENSTSQRSWVPHSIERMRYCFAYDEPCTPSGEWMPYESESTYELVVDWLGPRQIWLGAEFQDGKGQVVLALSSSSDSPTSLAQRSEEIVGQLDESTPIIDQPPSIQTAVAATRLFAPVSGSVLIEDGRCCAGGAAGETIDVAVSFDASSPDGDVTEMRVSTISFGCQQEIDLEDQPWEPFVSDKIFPVTTATNWIGFYVRVQFRDGSGNLSPIYCDDISIEGMPPAPGS